MTAQEAVSVGWANESFPADSFLERVQGIAEEMARAPLEMLHLQKKAINRVWDSQGFRASVLAGAEWDAVAHQVSELQSVREWIAELGVSGAARRYREQGL
jgi:enoyl-CoA hydratase